MAIQVIALKKGAITDELMATVLRESCDATSRKTVSSVVKDGYHIEKGRVGDKVEIQIYTKLPSGEKRAIVLSSS